MDVEVDTLVIDGTYKITTFPIKNEKGEINAVVHVARDVSMEKTLGEKLLDAEKLSSMGKLVAGIAHELNNPLMGIMGFSQLLMDTPDERQVKDVKGKLEKIYHESMRTARIVQNLLTFARATASKREYTDINETIKSTIDLRGYSLRSNNIEIKLNLDKTIPPTMVDKFQMQQVFINIINNAEDAMLGASGKGVLEIKTALKDGQIEITFSDDGPGVPPGIIGKVFDPFFTTKDVGRGTGLGLSITHGIVAEHGGSISMESTEGRGTRVRISLPVEDGAETVPDADIELPGKDLGGLKILLVEDEPSIRESISVFLREEGLAVDVASNGAEALKAMGEKEYALIVTDMKMSGINGIELYEQTAFKFPHLKKSFIMLTGDVFSEDTKAFIEEHGCPCLLKPFDPRELLEVIINVRNS
jgi:nitrogen-specific signal transduction histidine kinase